MVCMVYDFMCCIQSILWINDITCITFTRSLSRIPNSIIVIRFHIFNEFICIPSAFYSNDQHRTNNKLHANGTKNRLIWWQIKRFIQTNQFLLLAHNQLGIYSLCVDWARPRGWSHKWERGNDPKTMTKSAMKGREREKKRKCRVHLFCRKSRRLSTGFASQFKNVYQFCSMFSHHRQFSELRLMYTNNLVIYIKEWFGCCVCVEIRRN